MSQYVVRLSLNTGINTFNTIEEYQTFARSFPAINAMFMVVEENLAIGIMQNFEQVLTSPNTVATTMTFANFDDKQLYAADLSHEIREESSIVGMNLNWVETYVEFEE